jgi:hypothetical protein
LRGLLDCWTESIAGVSKLLGLLTVGLGTLAFVLSAWNMNYLAEFQLDSLAGVLLAFAVIGLLFCIFCVLLVILPGVIWLVASRMSDRPRPAPLLRPGIYLAFTMVIVIGWMLIYLAVPQLARWTSLAILSVPLLAYVVLEIFVWSKRVPKASSVSSRIESVLVAVCELFGLTCALFPLLFLLKLLPGQRTLQEVFPIAVGYGAIVAIVNTVIASYFDLPRALTAETWKRFRLVFWTVTVLAVVIAGQGLILGSVMRALSLGNVPNYELLVNQEGADIAAASGFSVNELTTGDGRHSEIFRVTGVDLVTAIGPCYVLKAHREHEIGQPDATEQYVLISKEMARGSVLNMSKHKRLMR